MERLKFKSPADLANRDTGFHADNLSAGAMAIPASTQQVCSLLSKCNEIGLAVVPQGGRTGLSGAAATSKEQIILDTSELNKIISIDTKGATAVVECGVTLSELESEVNVHGLTCGIDLAARGSATIGGMVSTNAGGIEAFRNGVMRNRVFGLEIVMADGRIVEDLKRVNKANEGYDIKQLFIGAEGTLGVITKIAVSLLPKPAAAQTVLISCKNASNAVEVFRALHNDPLIELLSAEIMWPEYAHTVSDAIDLSSILDFNKAHQNVLVIFEFAISTDAALDYLQNHLVKTMEKSLVNQVIVSKNQKERDEIWRIREDSFVVDDVYPHGFWFDMSVPLHHMSQYADTLFESVKAVSKDLKVFLFAHLGDGNFHATITTGYPATELEEAIKQAVYSGLNEIGGSFSAEHGIGIDKRDSLTKYCSKEKIELMRKIKQSFDPNGIMNPGKVL